MKNLFILIIVGAAPTLFAQKLKIDVAAGYGNGLTSISGVTETETETEATYEYKETAFPIRFNTGLTAKLGLSYMLSNNLFLSSAVRYQSSSMDFVGYSSDNSYQNQTYKATESAKIDFNSVDVQFGLGIEVPISERLSMSMSAGPSLAASSKLTIENRYEEEYQSPTYSDQYEGVYEQEFTPAFSIGAYGDAALNFKITDRFELFGNATFRMKSWSPKHSKITKYSENGEDWLPGLTTYQIETDYVDEYSNDYSVPTNQDQPSKSTKDWLPNSGIEYMLGVRCNLGAITDIETEAIKSGVYFELNGGYGIPMSGLSNYSTAYDGTKSTYSSEQYSYGSGVNFGGLVGYGLKNGISFELGAVYNKSKHEYENTHISATYYKNEASMLRTMLGFKLESNNPRINPFVRFGMLTGLKSQITEERISSNYIITTSERIEKYEGSLSFGGYTGLGVSFKLTETISLLGEVQAMIQNWSPGKSTVTKHSNGDVDQLADYTYSQIHTVYVDEIVEDQDSEYDENVAWESIKFSEPFSALTFKFGIRIDLRK